MRLLKAQQKVADANFDNRIFLEGIAGTGKTTAAIERVKQLIRDGTPADNILIIVPQMALALPYRDALRRSRVEVGGDIHTATLGSITRTLVDLFFPLVADDMGFTDALQQPEFLSLEMVQYYMTRFIEPQIEQNDYFNSVTIQRNRLYTQIVDNLNKAALVGFPHDSIGERLKSAWRGDIEQQYIYDDAQATASSFRERCLQASILDFSLQVEVFKKLWSLPQPRQYMTQQYRHLVVDNLEEMSPTAHDMLHTWLEDVNSAVLIHDSDAGFRRFLGADPDYAQTLRDVCDVTVKLDNHRVMSSDLEALQVELATSLNQQQIEQTRPKDSDPRAAIAYADNRFHPQMIEWTTDNIASLVHDEGVNAGDIVVLAPYLPDALRFALQTRLTEQDVPHRTHRPSRALREEPAARTLLTLAKVAHPQWGMQASKFDVAYALMSSISDMDLVRARLLADVLYRQKTGALAPFDQITNDVVQNRITFDLGNRYNALRNWIERYQVENDDVPLQLDIFFSKLFGEVLSQPHFGFHERYDAANTAANLIDSARQFRQTLAQLEPDDDERNPAIEYIQMVDKGVIANTYERDWDLEKRDAVLIAPAYTYLMTNQPSDYQFWLNVGSAGWAQRINQPLTHPYVLSRSWIDGRKWTDEDELRADEQTLSYLALGLIRRCRKKIYLGFSEFGEQGYEQRGPLLMAVQTMLRRLNREEQTNGI